MTAVCRRVLARPRQKRYSRDCAETRGNHSDERFGGIDHENCWPHYRRDRCGSRRLVPSSAAHVGAGAAQSVSHRRGLGPAAERPADGRRRQGGHGSRRPARLGRRALRAPRGSGALRRRVPRLEDRSDRAVRPRRQGREELRRRPVHLAARPRRRPRRQRLGDRRGRHQPHPQRRQARSHRRQVQPRRERCC